MTVVRVAGLGMLMASLASVMGNVSAASAVFLGSNVAGSVSMGDVRHDGWGRLLKKYVDDQGRVNYRSWKANRDDVAALDRYLVSLSATRLERGVPREAMLAFWINAYNAVTIRGILREYPTTSIRNHTPRLFGFHIWRDLKLYVSGTPFSLEQIEHQVLRKMREPRIHFAIVCASVGCPRLRNEAYVPGKVETQLEANAKDFFSRPKHFRYDESESTIYVSPILDWFEDDFGADSAARLRRIAPWLPGPAVRRAARENRLDVEFLSYDWDLNSQ